ncbi:MAG: 50S ribosomal protein L3 [Chloroflexota bacterium]|nr:MAG: 50S ribosomal protein L3 [Chloroflexota bacterium]
MIEGILGRKLGMSQLFLENGTVAPVTVIEAGPVYVTQIKTRAKDGYSAVQVGFGQARKLTSPEKGHLKKLPALKHLREFKVADEASLQVGQKIDASLFKTGEKVDVTGISKGKGFAGVVKRHGFAGGPKTHGQSDRLRAPGSVGSGTTPGRVLKGLRMAGHLGNRRVTVQNLVVVRVEPERNLIFVRGAVPGSDEGLVMIRRAIKQTASQAKQAAAQAKQAAGKA